ncbi:ecotropic viral integration site 5 ortholog [Mastacembelus armatus]|uniref:TBC1 domain family, member 10C n=1 Tax=Mastacembelus armatus TaxID=205130 RepID=A0A3Q3KYU4_9TELE|nr:ecotropic viral integration site 5 ortholog-like [Mastacembelus armatus]
MMSSSSPVQKNISEENSSGSDAGSEVSLEPETDRFGFILTNGSTAGSVGPPPELVRQREVKWINIIQQWDRILLKKTSKIKVQCQKGIPASLRAKCWPLLCGATDRMKQNEKLYQSLDSQPALQSWVDVIERDLDRQFPFHEMFLSKDGHGQRGLFRVLKAYTQYQPEEGYCQAQGPVAAVLLMNMPAEEAFWCLVQISEQYLPGYYSPLLEGVLFDAAMLTWVLKRTCPAAHKHLQHHGVEPLMFATDWLMCLFTRHLPFNTLLRVWDLFFCYGVRVLLQVAAVLVRRVLGRAEQRKKCEGQMETLEKLRGVREEVQEEDDAFIAEVCSVPLSAKDLEKHTEKELQKWKKERPSSTFDPRGRCQGYRMVWKKALQNKEDQDRKERETGNLSIPLARSASTLSLSPSLLHKKWRKGGKGNTGEWEGGGKVVRHLSMGAREDWRNWTELDFNKVQGVQEEEDTVSEEHKKQSNLKLTEQTVEKNLLEEPKMMETIQNIQKQHPEETVIVKEQIEHVETNTENKESQFKEAEKTETLPDQTEETNVGTEPNQSPDQTVENVIQPTEHTSQHKQDEDSHSQSQVEEQQNHKGQDQESEVNHTNEETRTVKVEESAHTTAVEENQSELRKDSDSDTNTDEEMQVCIETNERQVIEADIISEEGTETTNVQQGRVDTITEISETRSETDSSVEAPTIKHPDPSIETETQQQQEEPITQSDKSSQGEAFEVKCHSSESLAEMTEETYTQSETETDVAAQNQEGAEENAATEDELVAELLRTDSEQHTDSYTKTKAEILSSSECIQQGEAVSAEGDTETQPEIPVAHEIVTKSSEVFGQCSEKENDLVASEPTQEKEDSEAQVEISTTDQTQAEKTPTETQTKEETTDTVAPPQKEGTSTQAEATNLKTESDDRRSSPEISISEESAPEQLTNQGTVAPLGEEKSTEHVQEDTVGANDTFISTPNMTDSPHTVSTAPVQNKDYSQAESSNLAEASGHWRRSSGDFCVRKSSSTRGSRLTRRLSEDLFTTPQKASQSQPIASHPEVKHTESQSSPEGVNTAQTPPDVTPEVKPPLSTEVTEKTEAQQEAQAPPKRFGLFRRLKGDQPKKAKEKGVQKMQIPKILIQDFSDGTETGKVVDEEGWEKLSSRERRRRRRERERREKEEERLRKKKEKELEKERVRERRKPQTRGKSFQVQKEKGSDGMPHPAKTGSQTLRYSASYAESYF